MAVPVREEVMLKVGGVAPPMISVPIRSQSGDRLELRIHACKSVLMSAFIASVPDCVNRSLAGNTSGDPIPRIVSNGPASLAARDLRRFL
jgi:hypothetical protein